MDKSVFLEISQENWLAQDEYFFIIKDQYHVSPGHLLIISKVVRKDFFDLSESEKEALPNMIKTAQQLIAKEHQPDGYNIGMNCGSAAGQTVFHFHCHVIPRYQGDMEDPRGGVRHCVAGKGYY
ncbi:HIT family protein [Catalinimonas sp. 4WD22]|uniref:HIT family protein n=1 Tax=Catalinimonas locisalis TaxID=3133978 RepID=UPI0031016534